MADLSGLDAFLSTDARDVGCAEALRLLAAYVEIIALSSVEDAERRYPGVAVHLAACGPCGTDFEGLLAAALTWGTIAPEEPT